MTVASSVSKNDLMRLNCQEFHCPPSCESDKDTITAGTVKGTWRLPEDSLHPNGGWVFFYRNISQLLYWLQLVSATACVVLSLMRLAQQDYGQIGDNNAVKRNRRPALNIFYGLALSEALLFLAERAYWEWKVSHCLLLEEVNGECGLGPTGIVSVRRFFYDAHSRCIIGSIFDGIKMDMVGFAEELVGSGSRDEQLMGTRILLRFATNQQIAEPAVRKIATSPSTMGRLVEMLSWMGPAEEEIRMVAALVVSKLAGRKENALRVATIPGALESISSLLYTGGSGIDHMPKEVDNYMHSTFRRFSLLGLLILKKLAKEHENCGKIGNTRGLLPKIINFTAVAGQKLNRRCRCPNIDPDIKAVKRALQVLNLLAGTAGRTGELLRREISEIVFTVGSIRQILQNAGEAATPLRKLGLEILTSLAMEVEAREMIGATGGVLREMMGIFFDAGGPGGYGGEEWEAVRVEAGEALAMLAVESEENCGKILRAGEKVVGSFVGMVGDSAVRVNACSVLRNICAYGVMMDSGRRKEVAQAFSTYSYVYVTGRAEPAVVDRVLSCEAIWAGTVHDKCCRPRQMSPPTTNVAAHDKCGRPQQMSSPMTNVASHYKCRPHDKCRITGECRIPANVAPRRMSHPADCRTPAECPQGRRPVPVTCVLYILITFFGIIFAT
ncbi:hypothetical protein KSP39_PZI003790 [Platanthera zijinensis]|uniref:ARM repeat superfamily protein n=1 Tax=Platanthera zijinensis TaxID=2320716 RepID=A0AAP0BYX1_9ASPA